MGSIFHCPLQLSPGVFWSHDHSAVTSPVLVVQTVNCWQVLREGHQLATWIIVVWTLQLLFWLVDQLDRRSMTYQHYWHDVFYADTMQWCNSRIWNHQTFFTDLQTLDFLPEANFCQSLLALTPKLPVPPVPRYIQLHPSETCQVRRPGSARRTCRRYPFNDAETAAFLWGLIFDSLVGRKVLCMLSQLHVSRLQAPSSWIW